MPGLSALSSKTAPDPGAGVGWSALIERLCLDRFVSIEGCTIQKAAPQSKGTFSVLGQMWSAFCLCQLKRLHSRSILLTTHLSLQCLICALETPSWVKVFLLQLMGWFPRSTATAHTAPEGRPLRSSEGKPRSCEEQ